MATATPIPLPHDDLRPQSRTVSVEYAALALGIGRTTAFRLVRAGQFPVPTLRVGRRIVVPRAALDRLLDGSDAA